MKRPLARLLPWLLIPATALLPLPDARAGGTQSFVIDTSEAFEKGKLEGTAAHGDGRLTRSVSTRRTAIEGASVAYASAVGPDGAIYISTGNDGNVMRVDKSASKLFAHADTPLVSALLWEGDTLYAGTLGKGKVLAIDRKGSVRDFATLTGAAHVWALAHDPKTRTLYAATGPEGKLFAIDAKGAGTVLHDDEAEHLLSLARDAEGRLYAGTSNGARLVRLSGKTASVLYDAPGQEVTALALGPGFVAIASNEFSDVGDSLKDASSRARRSRTGKSKVFAVSLAGAVEELYRSDSSHVTALEVDAKGSAVHIGLGLEGRIVRAQKGQQQAVWADVDERQVVALHLNGPEPHFVSSDGVALYRVQDAPGEARWISAALDAKLPARFGTLSFRAKGKLELSTRSGNTETPDPSWSDWSRPLLQPGAIESAGARFLQLRATLSQDAELYALEAFYLPQNAPAYVRNVRVSGGNEKPTPSPSLTPGTAPKSQLTLAWDIDNPDGDKLRYRLAYRRDGQQSFLPLFPDTEVLDKNEYRWETLTVPDGYYRVRVEASDELTTPAPAIQKSEALSAPLLVDNHPPKVEELRVTGTRLSGSASDALGPVSLLELSLDGAPFRPIASVDGMLDSAQEKFELDLGTIGTGAHIVSVRASDAARNISTSALEFTVKR
jgi:hypothetical protein